MISFSALSQKCQKWIFSAFGATCNLDRHSDRGGGENKLAVRKGLIWERNQIKNEMCPEGQRREREKNYL